MHRKLIFGKVAPRTCRQFDLPNEIGYRVLNEEAMIKDCERIMGKAPGCKYFSTRERGINEWNAALAETKRRHSTWMLDSDNGKAGDVSPSCQDWYNNHEDLSLIHI